MGTAKTRVLVAGGGVAALEATIALRALAPDLVQVELLAPNEEFAYRPLAVTLPFDDAARTVRFDLAELAQAAGASLIRGSLTGIDCWRHEAHTSTNHVVEYDVLLVACGALAMPALLGAATFRGAGDAETVRGLLDELARAEIRSLAFVVPWGPSWPLPAYDLALLAGSFAPAGAELWLVTPEADPLQLFGPEASEAVRELLAEHGVSLRTGAYAARFEDRQLELVPGPSLDVDRVVALPRLAGAPIDGLPQTLEGFVPVDDHGRVHGIDDVYAAGDITSFPIKHGGLAAQLALAAAETIAAAAGADVDPRPFRPVVHGLLLTGSEPRFLRRELDGIAEHEPVTAGEALWWPPGKIAGRYLGPFLAERVGQVAADAAGTTLSLPAEIPLERDEVGRLQLGRLPVGEALDESEEQAAVSKSPLCLVEPEASLGEVAERLLSGDASAALVTEYGRLIGILTIHDLLAAFAARAHPEEARVRQWMTAEPVTLTEGSSSAEAVRVMRTVGIHHLPLVEDGRPVGIVHLDAETPEVMPVGLGF
jgi:sulfide:quinone oxidoreductase